MLVNPHNFAVIVPTLNAGTTWKKWLAALDAQTCQPLEKLIVDSGSEDDTVRLAKIAGFNVISIKKTDFDHGGTRQMAADAISSDVKILVFMTQDAILEDRDSFCTLLAAFCDRKVGLAYGRQLPRPGADWIETHARLYNYPDESQVRVREDIYRLGFKTAFCSNSFAAYRRKALKQVGGFPNRQIMIEDSIVGARLLLSGWSLSYNAEAVVIHSHAYSLKQEFSRYFDIGVSHSRNSQLLCEFGRPEGEGLRYVKSELKYLITRAPLLIPNAILRSFSKYIAYRFGLHERHLPKCIKRRLSMHKSFWEQESGNMVG